MEKNLSRFLNAGLLIVTVIVIAGPVSDPVNVPKLLLLGCLAIGLLLTLIFSDIKSLFIKSRFISCLTLLFLFWGIIVTVVSDAPLSQSLYGVVGRNSGFLTYVFFLIIFFTVLSLNSIPSIKNLLFTMTIALSINIVYATWWKLVGDPIPWNNNYGAFLGTFGNPNFAGAFLGFGSSYLLTLILENKLIFWKKFVSICAIILNTWAIILTDTTQGILVFLVTSSSILFFYLYSKYRNKIPSLTFLLLTVISGLFAIFGMLQKGPLSGLLYKRSVSLRGSYWEAAFTTGRENMLFGVGFDSFGDYYRRARSIKAATNLPGPEIVTNAAHNLFLDIFAYGGAVLLIIYVSIFSAGLIASVRIIKGLRSFEIVPIALISAYLGYLAQSIISISQIGIGIWGWVLNGGLIAYSRISRNPIENTMIRKKKIKLENPEQFTLFIGSVIGLLICLPPYLADSNFTRALQSRDLSKLEKSLKASYFNPLDAGRIANAVNILQNSNFPELSLEYNRKLVKFNPDYADGWKLLIYQSKASLDERLDAKENLIRLDPKNNFWKEFKI